MAETRFVLDTNVLVSAAILERGISRSVVNAVRDNDGILLFSQETFDELREVLHRAKFDPYLDGRLRAVYLERLRAVAEFVAISGAPMGCRDPKDDKFLETALAGRADRLVTGDKDLLAMTPFHGIPILTPADFLASRQNA